MAVGSRFITVTYDEWPVRDRRLEDAFYYPPTRFGELDTVVDEMEEVTECVHIVLCLSFVMYLYMNYHVLRYAK